MGNETCDLDSAVSALIQAFSEYLDGVKNKSIDFAVIPVMNICESEYRVKTEVKFFLRLHDITFDMLTFRDQIDLTGLQSSETTKLELVLVDHHALPDKDAHLANSVVKVIDHRPRDKRWPWPGREVRVQSVGSCATLIARDLFDKHPEAIDSRISSLLRGPILIDTSNFSKEVDRATPDDVKIIEQLENIRGRFDSDRDETFNAIVKAKTDISELTADDILIRDLKVTNRVPIAGLPMLVQVGTSEYYAFSNLMTRFPEHCTFSQDFLDRPDSLSSLERFTESRNSKVAVVIGLKVYSGTVSRDIAVFSSTTDPLGEKIIEALTTFTQPCLELTLAKTIREEGGKYSLHLYAQGNLRATRKQILPIIQDVVSTECRC